MLGSAESGFLVKWMWPHVFSVHTDHYVLPMERPLDAEGCKVLSEGGEEDVQETKGEVREA